MIDKILSHLEGRGSLRVSDSSPKEHARRRHRFASHLKSHERPARDGPSILHKEVASRGARPGQWLRGAIRAYEKLGIPIYDMVTAATFEGGDFNVIEQGCVLIGCGGARTHEEGARQVASWFEAEGWEVRLAFIDEYYVHIDLMVVPIAEKLIAVCQACTEPGIVEWLESKGHEILDVPFKGTMALGCNLMSLGNDKVIALRSSTTLIEKLRARGFEVLAVETDEISKTGGGIHCMAQALRRDATPDNRTK